jgi:hypothetical protein
MAIIITLLKTYFQKIPASITASFISFLATGIGAFLLMDYGFLSEFPLSMKISLFAGVLLNGLYFFYVEMLTELDVTFSQNLKNNIGLSELIIRISNQSILYLLWLFLQINLVLFAVGLIVLYIMYVKWDRLVKRSLKFEIGGIETNLEPIDLTGLIITVTLVSFFSAIAIYRYFFYPCQNIIEFFRTNPDIPYILGMFSLLYALPPIIGIFITQKSLKILLN